MANDDRNTDQEFQALTQVLEAEKHARTQLDAAQTQAEIILQEARNDARGIATRTDKRIQALHNRSREKIARKKLKLDEAFQRERGTRGTSIDVDKIKEATSRLAHQVVGVTPE